MKKSGSIKQILLHSTLTLVALAQIGPLLVVFMNSLRTDANIKNSPIGFPETFHFYNFVDAWVKGGYGLAYRNGIAIGSLTVLLICLLAGVTAYALVKLDIFNREFYMVYFVVAMSIPAFAYIVPVYYIFSKLHLVNNIFGMVLIYTAILTPFTLLLMRAFFIGIPKELEESSKVDGCSEAQALWHITIPLAKPIFTTVAVYVFVHVWNDFLWSNTFLQEETIRTVSVRFYKFVGRYNSNMALIYTAGLICIAPVCVVYLFLQKNFIEGITQGGLKG